MTNQLHCHIGPSVYRVTVAFFDHCRFADRVYYPWAATKHYKGFTAVKIQENQNTKHTSLSTVAQLSHGHTPSRCCKLRLVNVSKQALYLFHPCIFANIAVFAPAACILFLLFEYSPIVTLNSRKQAHKKTTNLMTMLSIRGDKCCFQATRIQCCCNKEKKQQKPSLRNSNTVAIKFNSIEFSWNARSTIPCDKLRQ